MEQTKEMGKKKGFSLLKNKHDELRCVWMLAMTMTVVYGVQRFISYPIRGIGLLAEKISGNPDIATDILYAVYGTSLIYVIICTVISVLLMLLFRIIYKRPFTQIGFCKTGSIKQMAFGLLFGIVTSSLVIFILLAIGSAQVVEINIGNIASSGVLNAFVIFLFVGFYEEILARGVMMTALKTTRNKWLIVFVPSAIFGLMHAMNDNVTVFSLVNIAFIGVLLSYLFVKTGRLWAPIGFHITWNLFIGTIYGTPVSGMSFDSIAFIELTGPVWLTGGDFGIEGGALCTVIAALGLVFIHFFVKKSEGYWYFDSNLPLTRGSL